MPNLDYNITADTTQAVVAMKLMEGQLRSLRKEQKSYIDEANKTGDTTKLTKVTQEIQRQEKAYASLKREVRGTTEATEGFGASLQHLAHGNRPVARLVREFGSLRGSIENTSIILGRLGGGLAGGVVGLAAFKGFEFLRDTINEVSKSLGELRKQAGDIGIKPIQLQGAQRAVGAIGEEADVATDMLKGMNAQLEELRKHPPGAGSTGAGSAFGVQVSRGGQPDPRDFSKPLQMLGIEAQVNAILPSRTSGLEKQLLILRAFVAEAKRFDPTALNIISKDLFSGRPSNTTLESATALIKSMEAEIENLKKSSAGATDAALEDDKKLRISKEGLAKSYEEIAGTLANSLRGAQIAFNTWLSAVLKDDEENIKEIAGLVKRLRADVAGPVGYGTIPAKAGATGITLPDVNVTGARAMPQVFQGPGRGVDDQHGPVAGGAGYGPGSRATQSITPGLSDYQAPLPNVVSPLLSGFGALAESSKSAAAAVADLAASSRSAAAASALAVPAYVNPVATPDSLTSTGFASGGFVRGPGTGTSDSILARLSAGEFVINSSSVRRLGAGFLSGLNGFAAGGLVGGIPSFAAGGLATAGGRAVHLHLGGGSFALSGHDSVVEALVSAAHSQQTRSAGVKPSWFGGRAGGH